MLAEIDQFVNWVRRRNPEARTWKDYRYDLRQFAALVGDRAAGQITFREIDRFVDLQRSVAFSPPPSTAAWQPSFPSITFLSDEDPALSARCCPAATPCASASACPARCRKKICGPSSPPSTLPRPPGARRQPRARPRHVPPHAALRAAHRGSRQPAPGSPVPGRAPSASGRLGQRLARTLGLPFATGRARPARATCASVRPSSSEHVFLSLPARGSVHHRHPQAPDASTARRPRSRSPPTGCAIPSPTICSPPTCLSPPSRSSSATAGWKPPRSTWQANDPQVAADYYAACEKLEAGLPEGWS